MQASVLSKRSVTSVGARAARPAPRCAPVRALPLHLLAEAAERTGTVDAPIAVPIIAGIVVAIAGTAIIPLALKPGQEAAETLFDARGKPIKKTTAKKK